MRRRSDKKLPWLSFYPADYLADTTHLTTQQHGAYTLLLWRYWLSGGIPNDDAQLAQIVRLPLDAWLQEKPIILAFFKPDLSHKRLDRERKDAARISAVRSKAAKQRKSAKPKQATDPPSEICSANAEQLLTQSQPQSQSQPQKIRGGGGARRVGEFSDEAKSFACELTCIAGYDPDALPPSWNLADTTRLVQRWISRGFNVDDMRQSAETLMAHRRGDRPNKPIFFDNVFASRHAPRLPLASRPTEVLRATPETDWRTRRDRKRAEWDAALDQLDAHIEQSKKRASGEG